MGWWDVELPSLTTNTMIGLSFKDDDGNTYPGGATGFGSHKQPPNKVRVIIWNYTDPDLEYAILWGGGCSSRGSMKNRFEGSAGTINKGKTIQISDPLLAALVSSTNESGKVSEEQIRLFIHTRERTENNPNQSIEASIVTTPFESGKVKPLVFIRNVAPKIEVRNWIRSMMKIFACFASYLVIKLNI